MNVYSARGGAVHLSIKTMKLPVCGALARPGVPYIATDMPVTCKKCLKTKES